MRAGAGGDNTVRPPLPTAESEGLLSVYATLVRSILTGTGAKLAFALFKAPPLVDVIGNCRSATDDDLEPLPSAAASLASLLLDGETIVVHASKPFGGSTTRICEAPLSLLYGCWLKRLLEKGAGDS